MAKLKWDSEKELAKAVVDDLRDGGWTVYPELGDIDIIATKADPDSPKGLKVIGVECKKAFNLTVLSQAFNRRSNVDEMWIAVGHGNHEHQYFGGICAEKFGIGVYFVTKWDNWRTGGFDYKVDAHKQPLVRPRKHDFIDRMLAPEAETFAEAGQAGGKHWTLFKKTSVALRKTVEEHPGCSVKDAVAAIEHHYSSPAVARSQLKKLIQQGVIEGVVLKGKLLYPPDKPV